MVNPLRNARDERGWRIPRPGSNSRKIYDLTVQGITTSRIIAMLSSKMKATNVRVLMHRFKHPEEMNKLFKLQHQRRVKQRKNVHNRQRA